MSAAVVHVCLFCKIIFGRDPGPDIFRKRLPWYSVLANQPSRSEKMERAPKKRSHHSRSNSTLFNGVDSHFVVVIFEVRWVLGLYDLAGGIDSRFAMEIFQGREVPELCGS